MSPAPPFAIRLFSIMAGVHAPRRLHSARVFAGLALLTCTALRPSAAHATHWIVPDQFPTIQAGVDFLEDAFRTDTLLVRPGTYPERVVVYGGESIVGHPLSSDPARMPRIDALRISRGETISPSCVGLWIAGPAVTPNYSGPTSIHFESCRFDSGMSYGGPGRSEINLITMKHCTSFGLVELQADEAYVDSCTFHGSLSTVTNNWSRVGGNTFDSTSGTALRIFTVMAAYIGFNFVRGCGVGLDVVSDDGGTVRIEENHIEDCAGDGIRAYSHNQPALQLYRNRVERCGGTGITGFGYLDVWNNMVLDCGGTGMVMTQYEEEGAVASNVVGRCGNAGIRFLRAEEQPIHIAATSNTVFGCAGSGYDIFGVHVVASRNIAYGNGGFGLTWSGPVASVLSCNDWFANVAGVVNGLSPDPTDLAIDPDFCNLSANDAHLIAGSPLLDAPGCGWIGALGAGCTTTGALDAWLLAERLIEGVRVRWQVTGSPSLPVSLERAEELEGPWSAVEGLQSRDGDASTLFDRQAVPGREYWYRLRALEDGAWRTIGTPARVEAGPSPGFEIVEIIPNPGSGPARVTFTLPRDARVELDVFDVQGRHTASLLHGTLPAGTRVTEWSGIDHASGAAPAGIYLVRYRFPGGQQVSRFVRSR